VQLTDLGSGQTQIEWSCEANPNGTTEEAQEAVHGMYTMMIGWLGDALRG
jgi:hypothetical protein